MLGGHVYASYGFCRVVVVARGQVQVLAAGDRVVDDVALRPCRRRYRSPPQGWGDFCHRDYRAVDRDARDSWWAVAYQLAADGGADPVGADEGVAFVAFAGVYRRGRRRRGLVVAGDVGVGV